MEGVKEKDGGEESAAPAALSRPAVPGEKEEMEEIGEVPLWQSWEEPRTNFVSRGGEGAEGDEAEAEEAEEEEGEEEAENEKKGDHAHPLPRLSLDATQVYYHNLQTGEVQWEDPANPEVDVWERARRERHGGMDIIRAPEDAPAPPLQRRAAAAAIDAAAAIATGVASGLMFYFEIGDATVAQVGAGGMVWVSWISRDALFDAGTRSLGKRQMGIEIIKAGARTAPNRLQTVARNSYHIVYAGTTLLMPWLLALPALEAVTYRQTGRRLGDWLAFTKVIEEQPCFKKRIEQKKRWELVEG